MEKVFICGSVESSDVLIKYDVTDKPITINIESKVMPQFGKEIEQIVSDFVKEHSELKNGVLSINDQGAVPTVIKARLLGLVAKMKGAK